jgi:hypothetical protein
LVNRDRICLATRAIAISCSPPNIKCGKVKPEDILPNTYENIRALVIYAEKALGKTRLGTRNQSLTSRLRIYFIFSEEFWFDCPKTYPGFKGGERP